MARVTYYNSIILLQKAQNVTHLLIKRIKKSEIDHKKVENDKPKTKGTKS